MDQVEGKYKVANISLADEGRKLIDWAESRMPVMMSLRKKYSETKPLAGYRIAGCLHVTKETAVLIRTLREAGAEISWSGCNPLSTHDAVAAALAEEGVKIYAWHGLNVEEFYWCIDQTLLINPNLSLDDGADLIFTVHNKYPHLIETMVGGTEETTTGVHRLRAMAADGALKYPVIAVNDAETKWDFDNVYGTGQSTLDGVIRATSVMLAGKNIVVAGYGHCGKGVALRAKGMGANVIITEIKPTAALKATLEGMRVMEMEDAAKIGDIFITATGIKDIITGKHFASMKEGAIVCNTGHYDCEIKIDELQELSVSKRTIRDNNEEYIMKDGRKIYVLAEGRLVNLAAAEGHPSEVMDMSFANQFLSQVRLAEMDKSDTRWENKVYDITLEQDQMIAKMKLETMGINIDSLTSDQIEYMNEYAVGT
ncbi:MAG: adenosylhomocysteinase [Chlorobiota bacterium]|nr:adenosylhomocysteinase [Chlorobiota bacterium]QQS67028.1 MAG: adenosylhomocysteinase [Chlorobiota bacterium]